VKAPANVERGAAFLDERDPNWPNKIDVGRLDLGDCERCILGQLYVDYDEALTELSLSAREAERLGFNTVGPQRYWHLTAGWIREVLSRRTAA